MYSRGRQHCAQSFVVAVTLLLGAATEVASTPVSSPRAWLDAARSHFGLSPESEGGSRAAEGEGPASLLQLDAEALTREGPLFNVKVMYDRRQLDGTKGITMKMMEKGGSLQVIPGVDKIGSVGWARVEDKLDTTGWIELYVSTADEKSVPNDVRMYAAGFMEGILTAERLSQFYSNFFQMTVRDQAGQQALVNIRKAFQEEFHYAKKNANLHGGVVSVEPVDPYWKHARYLLLQMWGIMDAYNQVANFKGVRKLDMLDMLIINNHAELPELMQAYTTAAYTSRRKAQGIGEASLLQRVGGNASFKASTRRSLRGVAGDLNASDATAVDHDWEMRLAKRGRCSALVSLASESKDVLVGHTTWSDYSKMTRLFKYYHIPLPDSFTTASVIGMSSYPGCVSSTDDFYFMDNGLVVMDTSLEILNAQLYDRVAEFPVTSHLPTFMKVMVSNRMAKTASHWAVLFSGTNTGTGNAQWMIVDYNKFAPGKPLHSGVLWVLEQAPGTVAQGDMTLHLRDHGYWASFNRPFFPSVRDVTGHTAAERRYGNLFSYGNSPRASIFRYVAPEGKDLASMRVIMNRNSFPKETAFGQVDPSSTSGVATPVAAEPLAQMGVTDVAKPILAANVAAWRAEAGHAISARMDLGFSRIPNGGIDSKVLNRCMLRALQCQAISGPTHDSQPVFRWRNGEADLFPGWPHMGLPDVWNFGWVQMGPDSANAQLSEVTC